MKRIILNSQFSIFNFTALLLVGGAFLVLGGCGKKRVPIEDVLNPDAIVTQQTINHTLVRSLNGVRQYRAQTPLMENHDMAREPFTEFPNGIEITTYDSLGEVESTMRANYAIYYEKRRLWEARGNVVGHNIPEERTLRTEQLFWDEKMERVYSNVNSYVEQKDGIHFGEGFESDSDFRHWLFRNYRGRVVVDTSERENSEGAVPAEAVAPTPVAPAVTPATHQNTVEMRQRAAFQSPAGGIEPLPTGR